MAKPKGAANGRLVPGVGTIVELNHDLLFYDTANSSATMARIVYDHENRCWKMQPFAGEGLIVFFTDAPKEHHAQFVIDVVLPTQTACYGVAQ